MPDDLMQEEFGYEWGEDILVLAALRILGLHGAYDPAAELDIPRAFPLDTIGPLKKLGANVPWIFNKDHQHTGIRSGMTLDDADRAVAVMKKAADRMDDLPELFARYQEQMRQMNENPPWEDQDIWSM
jgi:hypothetical protein